MKNYFNHPKYILVIASIVLQSCLIIVPIPNTTQRKSNRYDAELTSSTIAYQNRESKNQLIRQLPTPNSESIITKYGRNSGSAEQIAGKLTSGLTSDWEKAWVLFRWISEHIDYDVVAFNSGRYYDTSCSTTLKRGKAVCGGYAELVETMFESVGIPTFTISGYARGAGFSPGESTRSNHAWNAAKLDGKWYLMDATWGSGSIDSKTNTFNRKFKEFYFAAVPSELIITHFPDNPKYQFVEKTVTKTEFSNKPRFYSGLHEFGIIPDPKLNLTMTSNGVSEYRFKRSQLNTQVMISAKPVKNGQSIDGIAHIRNQDATLRIQFPKTGKYEITVYAGPFESDSYPSVLSWYEDVTGIMPELPEVYNKFTQSETKLISPLEKQLSTSKKYKFEIDCPDATDIALVVNTTWKHLEKKGSVFYGEYSGDAYTVYAKFSDKTSYSGLVQYDKK